MIKAHDSEIEILGSSPRSEEKAEEKAEEKEDKLIKEKLRGLLNREHNTSTTEHLIDSVPHLMKGLSKVSLKGVEKKKILLASVVDYINEEEDPEDAAVLFFLYNVIDPLIEVLIQHGNIAAAGEESVKRIKECCVVQ
jgi:hypothetical protein